MPAEIPRSTSHPKLDVKKTLDSYRAPQGDFRLVDVPTLQYLMVDGQGDPNTSPAFAEALSALYPVAYKLKFASKNNLQRDYVVPPLEGLWWADDMKSFTTARDKSAWSWTMMLLVPEWLGVDHVDEAIETVAMKNPSARLADVRFAELTEGPCVQTLHVGSFDDEATVLHRMHHKFIPEQGLRLTGTHHEVYFSDLRRTAPERMRTLLRQPVAPA